jgi:hypothetical protein
MQATVSNGRHIESPFFLGCENCGVEFGFSIRFSYVKTDGLKRRFTEKITVIALKANAPEARQTNRDTAQECAGDAKSL